jgi:D-arabinan exo alpha-(1,3)/(1,5)-arabinofuranosidase (non-reducing end)
VFHRQGTWWGEGNDMIFVDDDTWPPSLHGTGTEDYFNHAWGMQKNAYPFHGAIIHESDVPGYSVNYRFHVADPVRFNRRIKVSIEHGHGNHLADDWASTAYWYQQLPSPTASILPLEQRLPTRPPDLPMPTPAPRTGVDADEVAEAREHYRERFAAYQARMAERTAQRVERSQAESAANTAQAADLRRRFR